MKFTKLRILLGIVSGVVYGIVLRLTSDSNLFSGFFGLIGGYVMSFTFIFIVPFVIGVICLYFCDNERKQKLKSQIFLPWLSILILLLITLAFQIEGVICVIMAVPVFMVLSSLGGIAGATISRNENKLKLLFLNLFLILPLLTAPLETKVERPSDIIQVDTQIQIDSDIRKVWENIVTVSEIKESENKPSIFQFMGFPRPIIAELDYEGIGGTRKAIFDKGLFFTETIIQWDYLKTFTFKIESHPNSTPPSALDEHVLVGGDYFDVLEGTYCVDSSDKEIILHLHSKFRLSTNFNIYAGIWSKLIMKDIQNNILSIIKDRCQKHTFESN